MHGPLECQIITDCSTSVSARVRYVVIPSISHALSSLSEMAVEKKNTRSTQDTVQMIALCYSGYDPFNVN
jgi:hypothetical protein